MNLRALLLAGLALTAACQRTEAPPVPAPSAAVPAPSLAAAPSPSPSPHAALDALDARKPVPLLPMMAHHQKQNMQDHLLAVQEIVAAVAVEDFAAVERAAGRIASSPQMAQMCTHMGAGAPGFSAQALGFHQTADAIGPAAAKRDGKGVLAALGKTLATCTACHATWKQAVVDDKGWAAAANQPAPGADEAMRHQHEMMMRTMQQQR